MTNTIQRMDFTVPDGRANINFRYEPILSLTFTTNHVTSV